MAQTTTAASARAATAWLDSSAGGSLANISGSTTSIEPDFGLTLGEYRVFQDRYPHQLDGGRSASITLNVVYSTTASEGWAILRDWYQATNPGARTLDWYAPDATAGSDHFSCEVRIESLRHTLAAGDGSPIIVTARLVPDGTISRSVVT